MLNRTQQALCGITSHAQNSPPSLVCATFTQTFVALVLFSRGYSFHLDCFGNKIYILFYQSEAWWWFFARLMSSHIRAILIPEILRWGDTGRFWEKRGLRTFAPIVSAHPYTQIHMHVMHRARGLSTKLNNNRADSHCYSFACISRSWTFGDPHFSFPKQILFTIIYTLTKNDKKSMWEGKISSRFLSTGHQNLP